MTETNVDQRRAMFAIIHDVVDDADTLEAFLAKAKAGGIEMPETYDDNAMARAEQKFRLTKKVKGACESREQFIEFFATGEADLPPVKLSNADLEMLKGGGNAAGVATSLAGTSTAGGIGGSIGGWAGAGLGLMGGALGCAAGVAIGYFFL